MWWLWLLVALGAAVAEIAVSGLIFAGIAGAALAASLLSIFVSGILPGAIVFAAVTIIYLVTLRPVVLRLLPGLSPSRTAAHGPQSLAGRRAVASQEITPNGGQIRVGQGEYWSARSYDGKETIPEGTLVEVVLVEGLTALVWRPE